MSDVTCYVLHALQMTIAVVMAAVVVGTMIADYPNHDE